MDDREFRIQDFVLDWLLEPSDPILRWWTLRDLLDRPLDDPEVEAARSGIPVSEPASTILSAQRPRGAWANDKHLYSPKHTATHGQLDLLAGFGYGPDDEQVARTIRLVLSRQRPDGVWDDTGPLAFGGETLYPFGTPGEPEQVGHLPGLAGAEARERGGR